MQARTYARTHKHVDPVPLQPFLVSCLHRRLIWRKQRLIFTFTVHILHGYTIFFDFLHHSTKYIYSNICFKILTRFPLHTGSLSRDVTLRVSFCRFPSCCDNPFLFASCPNSCIRVSDVTLRLSLREHRDVSENIFYGLLDKEQRAVAFLSLYHQPPTICKYHVSPILLPTATPSVFFFFLFI